MRAVGLWTGIGCRNRARHAIDVAGQEKEIAMIVVVLRLAQLLPSTMTTPCANPQVADARGLHHTKSGVTCVCILEGLSRIVVLQRHHSV